MGGTASRPEEVASLAQSLGRHYRPPFGPPRRGNPLIYFDIKMGRNGGGIPIGRIILELKEDVVPLTAENFKQLSLRPAGEGLRSSRFHRIIPGFMCQGGDFTNDNGTGGRSAFGTRFPDENFVLSHTGPGVLSMANAGPNTNGSQFFLCLAATPWLNRKHVVFGQVVGGYGVLKAMETFGSRSGETSQDVVIGDCGALEGSACAQFLAEMRIFGSSQRTNGGGNGSSSVSSRANTCKPGAAGAAKVAIMRLNRAHKMAVPRPPVKVKCGDSLCTASSPLSDGRPRRAIIITKDQYVPALAKVV